MSAARLGADGWCPECESRLVLDHDYDDETCDGKDRVFCEECGWTPAAAPDLMDVVKIQHEEAEAS